jgi:His-Xaa-Ser system protein HxsD
LKSSETNEGSKVSRSLTVATTVYSLDTVKKAAYRFIDRFALDIDVKGNELHCLLSFNPGIGDASASATLDDFKRELLDQDLREKVAKETAPLRNTILALAFAQSSATPRE